MKRRKALLGISLLTGGAILSYLGFKWIRLNSAADLDYLKASKKMLASLVDVIIPKTDSPSASECNVHEFIIKMVTDCTEVNEQNNFVLGLKALEDYCLSKVGKSFLTCSDQEKIQVLTYFENKDKPQPGSIGKIQRKFMGKSFFATLREYSVIGYFSSEQGAKQALQYSHIPGRYSACEPYTQGGKAWATF